MRWRFPDDLFSLRSWWGAARTVGLPSPADCAQPRGLRPTQTQMAHLYANEKLGKEKVRCRLRAVKGCGGTSLGSTAMLIVACPCLPVRPTPQNSFALQEVHSVTEDESPAGKLKFAFFVLTPRRTYTFRCPSKEEMEVWMLVFNSAIKR